MNIPKEIFKAENTHKIDLSDFIRTTPTGRMIIDIDDLQAVYRDGLFGENDLLRILCALGDCYNLDASRLHKRLKRQTK